ncbi:hypothetical protein [Actinoallomurus iriomotensis]|uniref:Uncharacterized protein n=1 Tax=Actinoallomurus iriomotensis TaxID=478107 RepID=A0A9W6S5P9_9ACTN|nr:hypothetical protein [Actinoallomurus iriomotensis]GLY87554.1 hypothetical protein Airi02_054830 [Actinoallomurus iriomotensis]
MTTFRRPGQTRGVAVFGVLFQRPGGLHRVMIAAAVIGAALARAFVPKRVAERTAVPPARDLTGPGAQR